MFCLFAQPSDMAVRKHGVLTREMGVGSLTKIGLQLKENVDELGAAELSKLLIGHRVSPPSCVLSTRSAPFLQQQKRQRAGKEHSSRRVNRVRAMAARFGKLGVVDAVRNFGLAAGMLRGERHGRSAAKGAAGHAADDSGIGA